MNECGVVFTMQLLSMQRQVFPSAYQSVSSQFFFPHLQLNVCSVHMSLYICFKFSLEAFVILFLLYFSLAIYLYMFYYSLHVCSSYDSYFGSWHNSNELNELFPFYWFILLCLFLPSLHNVLTQIQVNFDYNILFDWFIYFFSNQLRTMKTAIGRCKPFYCCTYVVSLTH